MRFPANIRALPFLRAVLTQCSQPFPLKVVNQKREVLGEMMAFPKFLTVVQKKMVVWVSILTPMLGSTQLEKCTHTWTHHHMGSEKRQVAVFVQEKTVPVCLILHPSLIAIAASLCTVRGLVVSLLPSPEQKSLSEWILQGFEVVTHL